MERRISEQLFEAAQQRIPGGVNSPVRAWKAVGGTPLFIDAASGCRVIDADGNSYIDYVASWGPMIAGHAAPEVLRAVGQAMKKGLSFGAPTRGESELAQRIGEAFPAIERARLVSSGTEAAMTAVRLARAATGRAKIIKFAGCYHGHSDAVLVRAGSGALTLGIPDSPGVPAALASLTLVASYNDLEGLEQLFAVEGGDVAAVIIEPVVGNSGVIRPRPGFLEGLRRLTEEHGALLIFDEVITGFRVAYGGVQTQLGLRPDLTCLGKIVGGGLPLAAVGGRAELMAELAPEGSVYQAGTLSGNPLAVAAGLATLDRLRQPGVYESLDRLGARLEEGLVAALRRHRVRGCVNRVGSMWTLFLGVDAVADAEDAKNCDTRAFARFFTSMLENGVYLPPSAFEAAFLSLAHGEAEVEATLRAADEALAALH
jgi:glutamate-1-semialdehyde 2,1-aminomutase